MLCCYLLNHLKRQKMRDEYDAFLCYILLIIHQLSYFLFVLNQNVYEVQGYDEYVLFILYVTIRQCDILCLW